MMRVPQFSLLLLLCTPCVAQQVQPTSANLPLDKPTQSEEIDRIVGIALNLGPKASTPAQLVQLTRDLQAATAAEVFLRVAEDFLRQGKIDVAADVITHLIKLHPREPASERAGLLLVRLYSSREIAYVYRRNGENLTDLNLPPGWQSRSQRSLTAREDSQALLTYSTHVAQDMIRRNRTLAEDAEFAFQCAVLSRSGRQHSEAKSWLTIARHQEQFPAWQRRAEAELWLQDQSQGEAPLPTFRCRRGAESPHLDGVLDDACWQTAEVLKQGSPATEVFLACDEKHLYLAARCEKHPELDYIADRRPRTYDADLSELDRVELRLDVDRDYVSCFRLTVDHRGWTNDACWLDESWNPRWYVAAHQDQTWNFEAAIPWSELTSGPPQSGQVWAVRARRLTPAVEREPEADFQLLLFD